MSTPRALHAVLLVLLLGLAAARPAVAATPADVPPPVTPQLGEWTSLSSLDAIAFRVERNPGNRAYPTRLTGVIASFTPCGATDPFDGEQPVPETILVGRDGKLQPTGGVSGSLGVDSARIEIATPCGTRNPSASPREMPLGDGHWVGKDEDGRTVAFDVDRGGKRFSGFHLDDFACASGFVYRGIDEPRGQVATQRRVTALDERAGASWQLFYAVDFDSPTTASGFFQIGSQRGQQPHCRNGVRTDFTLTRVSGPEVTFPPAPEPGAGIPQPSSAPGCVGQVAAGDLVAVASCFKRTKGGTYATTGRVRVNGLDVGPRGGRSVVVDPAQEEVRSAGADFSVGSVLLSRGVLRLRGRGGTIVDADAGAKLKGLEVKGEVLLAFAAGTTTLEVKLELPEAFGGVTGDATVTATNEDGLELGGLELTVGEVVVAGAVEVRDLTLALEVTAGGKPHFRGGATVYLGLLPSYGFMGSVGFGTQDGFFELGFGVDGLNKPLFGPVLLQRIRATVGVNPYSVSGGAGITLGPQVKARGFAPVELVSADGDVSLVSGDATTPTSLTLKGKGNVLEVRTGELEVRADFGQSATLKAKAELTGLGGYGFRGDVAGYVDKASASIDGSVRLSLPGKDVGAKAIVSTVGAAACSDGIGPDVGIGYFWSGELRVFSNGCGLGPFRPVAASRGVRQAGALGAVTVTPGQRTLVVSALGTAAPPLFAVLGPDGTRVEVPRDGTTRADAKAIAFADPGRKESFVAIDAPRAGTWTVVPLDGSPPATAVRSAAPLPRLDLRVRLRGRGRTRTLAYTATGLAGRTVRLLERGTGIDHPLGTIRRARGTLRFAPELGRDRTRRIEAVVLQDGLGAERRDVARFRVTGRQALLAPRGVRLVRSAERASVRWRAAPDAVRYVVRAVLPDGRRLVRLIRARRLTLAGVSRGAGRVTATVRALDAQGRVSAPAAARR